jgi:hypothetical protein
METLDTDSSPYGRGCHEVTGEGLQPEQIVNNRISPKTFCCGRSWEEAASGGRVQNLPLSTPA